MNSHGYTISHSAPQLYSSNENTIDNHVFTDREYFHASELLDTFLGSVPKADSFYGQVRSIPTENRHLECMLAYETFKFLKFIDTIIIKTQFLVAHPQLISKLSLLKVILYEIMRHEFALEGEKKIRFIHDGQASETESVVEIVDCITQNRTNLAAAYARIRIEKQAGGSSPSEVLNNILPEEQRQQDAIAGKA
jgi:hypothetical protein